MKSACLAFFYQNVLKKLLFLLPPMRAHTFMVRVGKVAGGTAVGRRILAALFKRRLKKPISCMGLTFSSPVGLSAGFDYNADLPHVLPSLGFGFATLGTITLHPSSGNKPPQLTRLVKSKSILVNKGFKNAGSEAIIKKLKGQNFSIPIGISIGSTNKEFSSLKEQVEDVQACFKAFEDARLSHAYYELNISCPNIKNSNTFYNPLHVKKLLSALNSLQLQKPVLVKMPIDLPWEETLNILHTLESCPWIRGVIFGNLTKDKTHPAFHKDELQAVESLPGGFSGKPTYEKSLMFIQRTRAAFKKRFVIVGVGGIFSPEDALEKIRNGADLVQLITGMIFVGPQLVGQITKAYEHMQETG